jgi:uncharacterized membrane protein
MAKKNTGMAFLSLILGWVGVVIAVVTKKDDKYVMYYAKQSLAIAIAQAVIGIVGFITMFILIGFLILPIGLLVVSILWIIAMVNSLSGKEKPLPMLQWLADKFDF